MLGTLDKVQVLRKVSLFQGLVLEDLVALGRIADTKRYEADEVIFRENDPGTALFVVMDGRVEIIRETEAGEKPVSHVESHGYFGEMALLDDQPRSATARVKEPSLLLLIHKDDFRQLLSNHQPLSLELLRLFSARIRQINVETDEED